MPDSPNSVRRFLPLLLLAWAFFAFLIFVTRPPEFWMVFPSLLRIILDGTWMGQWPVGFGTTLIKALIGYVCFIPIGLFVLRGRRVLRSPIGYIIAFLIGWGMLMFALEITTIYPGLDNSTLFTIYFCAIASFILSKYEQRRKGDLSPASSFPESPQDSYPLRGFRRVFWWCAFALIACITGLTFYHALLYPETYWDSLILYVHYAESIFREGRFPLKVCLQVGDGLGANYPHWAALTSATIATFWGEWNDLYAQLFPPLLGLFSVILLYDLFKLLFKDRLVAILGALLFRSFAYATAYFIWATDYSVVIWLATCVLWLCVQAINTGSKGYLAAASAAVACAMHINYLGGLFMVPVLVAWFLLGRPREFKVAWRLILICLLLGSTWYIRNWIVTGNPVYAFFPEIFGGKNIDLEVLASCQQEWLSNGDGVARLGSSLLSQLLNAPIAFLLEPNYHWKFGPILFGLSIPGLLLYRRLSSDLLKKAYWVCLSLLAVGFFFEFFISGLYLYHVLFVVPALAFFALLAVREIQTIKGGTACAALLVILIGLVPGLSMALVGPKLMSFDLQAFKYPGMDQKAFYRMRFGDDAKIWEYINDNLPEDAGVLTHENRYHVWRRDLRIIHLDDWDFSRLYDHPFSEVRQKMAEKGIEYYYYIPNEDHHPITRRLGIHEHLNSDFEELYRAGSRVLYRLK